MRPTALVTGAGRRLGAAMAWDLARRGWDLWLHCHQSRTEAEALAGKIQSLGRQAWVIAQDLAAPEGAEQLVLQLQSQPPRLVVHSASLWQEDTLLTATAADWEMAHRLQVWTTIVLARALASQSSEGHLITLLDARSRDRDAKHFSYAFAKRELLGLTRYLAAELAPTIRVNGLALGLVLKGTQTSPAQWRHAARLATPLERTGSTQDVLRGLRYLLTNSFVTGQILTIDGGRHLQGDLFGSL